MERLGRKYYVHQRGGYDSVPFALPSREAIETGTNVLTYKTGYSSLIKQNQLVAKSHSNILVLEHFYLCVKQAKLAHKG